MIVRALSLADKERAREIARIKNKTSGTSPITDEGLDILLDSIGVDSPRKLFGYFEGEELVSWLAIRNILFFNNETCLDEKAWLILGLFTSRFHNNFSFTHPEVGMLLKMAFEVSEANGRYTYVYSIANRLERVYEKQWAKQNWIPMTGRYELITLNVVPANTRAPEEWQYRMMGGEKPDDVVFKKRVLKYEFRK